MGVWVKKVENKNSGFSTFDKIWEKNETNLNFFQVFFFVVEHFGNKFYRRFDETWGEQKNWNFFWGVLYPIFFCINLVIRVKLDHTPNFRVLAMLTHYYSGWTGGRAGGRLEELKIRLNSVQFRLKLPVWTELGNS